MKNYSFMAFFASRKTFSQIILYMKLFVTFMFCTILSLHAKPGYSQKERVRLNVGNSKISDVLKEIEKQTDYLFFYNHTEIGSDKIVSLETSDVQVNRVLDQMFKNTDVKYTVLDKHIILTTNPEVKKLSTVIQGITISGVVTDENGDPMPGVNAMIKGTVTGVVTDLDGKYTINVPGSDAVLQFSFVGYAAQEITVGDQRVINVTLGEDTQEIEEIVVVGYGVVRKRDLTGAVSQISSRSIKDFSISHSSQAMQGQVAGVQVRQTSANPGAAADIKVRGSGSLYASGAPLYVVDGYPLGDQNLSVVNPNDIESIEILKDASSAAIYGSRGSNGVVMVTTKSGKSGQRKINLDAYVGWQQVEKTMDVLSKDEFIEFSKDAFNTNYLAKYPGASITDPISARPNDVRIKYPEVFDTNPAGLPNTNWQDEIFKVALMQNYQLSVNGGDDKTQYFFAGGYYDQDGIIINTDYRRFNLKAKIDSKVNNFLKLGVNVAPSYSIDNRALEGHYANDGVVVSALSTAPITPVYDADGKFTSQTIYNMPNNNGLAGIPNAVANTTILNKYTTLRVLANMYAEIDIVKGLKFRTTVGGDVSDMRRNYFRPSNVPMSGKLAPGTSSDRKATATATQNYNWLNENTFHYNNVFNDIHALDAVAGFTLQKNTYETNEANGSEFANDVVRVIYANLKVNSGTSDRTEWSMMSYLGRINYRLMDRYYLTASIRADGCSKFGKNNRFGYFPSGSLAWKISEESFMQEITWLSDLKIRSSYGLSGNNATPMTASDYVALGLVGTDNYVFGTGSGTIVSGDSQTTIENKDLTWEKSKQFDIGLEFGVFNNRVHLTADYYNRKTTDMLMNVDIPSITGYTNYWTNIGEMENKGFELTIGTKNFVGQDFKWNTDFNISFNRNKVLALGPFGDPIRSNGGVGDTHITMIGQPIGCFYGYRQIGIFQNNADLASYPHVSTSKPGDAKYENVDNTGASKDAITAEDRTIIGNNHPDFTWGLNNTFSYKFLDLSITMYGSHGAEVLHLARRFYENLEGIQQQIGTVRNRWRSESDPGAGLVPKANAQGTGQNGSVSSRWVEDASFVRISNITLGANFPQKWTRKIGMQAARMYVSVQNVYTFTDYLGYNPEVSFRGGDVMSPGTDYGGYPTARTWTVGCNLTF